MPPIPPYCHVQLGNSNALIKVPLSILNDKQNVDKAKKYLKQNFKETQDPMVLYHG